MAANDVIRTIKHKEQTLKQTKGQARAFAKDLYRALDARDDVSYNLADKEGVRAYEQTERFRKSGLTKTQLSALIQKAIQNIPAQQVYKKTIQPVYTVKENSIFSTIHTTGIPPQVYPVAQTVYEAHKTNGTLDALMASYTGTRVTDATSKAVIPNAEHAAAVPIGHRENTANTEQAAFMQATQGTAWPAHGDAESRTRAAGTAESASEAAVSQAPAGGTGAREKTAPSPALSCADKEKLCMARINANYEHDKKLLAKTDPLFAKNRFWDAGHAEENGEKLDEGQIKKDTAWFEHYLNDEIKNRLGVHE